MLGTGMLKKKHHVISVESPPGDLRVASQGVSQILLCGSLSYSYKPYLVLLWKARVWPVPGAFPSGDLSLVVGPAAFKKGLWSENGWIETVVCTNTN